MSVIVGSATVPSSTTIAAFTLPPGYSNFTMYQSSGRNQVYVGTSISTSTVNGMYVPITPLTQETYTGSAGATVYATTGGTAASSFNYIISTTQ